MIAELGHFALVLAFAIAIAQTVLSFWGARALDVRLIDMGRTAAVTQFLFFGMGFAFLTMAYVGSDFSVKNVWENSHSTQPLLYKFTSVWGNHEGSMLLWVVILSLFGALVAVFGNNVPASLRALVVSVQGLITSVFALFLLVTSNPFIRLDPAPIEGQDLNPILQDLGLAIHPPMLYLGYVGFSVAFSFAIAALIDGRIDAAWARWVRPWTLIAWIFLTLGIAMGSYWAYYELGWGGWWFWDPVENASFMPWLAGTALLHSAIVMEKRDALKVWTILLAILTFSLSLLGAFLVRSGILTSVHSFASDPERGLFILMILFGFIGGALTLFAWRGPQLSQGGLFQPISREGALVFNNLFISAATIAVLTGTLYPLALEAINGSKISVGAPFFNITFGPLMVPLLIAIPFGPLMTWKRGDLLAVAQRLMFVFGLVIVVTLAFVAFHDGGPVLAPIGIGLSVWLVAGSLVDLWERSKLGKVPFSTSVARLTGLPRSVWGTTFGHMGMGVALLGIVYVSAFEIETVLVMKPGETTQIAGFDVKYNGIREESGPNYSQVIGTFVISIDGQQRSILEPAKRIYQARQVPTTEAARYGSPSELYISIGDFQKDEGIVVRIYYKPLIQLIWIGCIFMAFGGAISLTDRRLRVGAPKRARAKQAMAG
ncbi:MAG: heme lyase CcmF/NrfE family subunit [Cohaesibacteraceae bacterium]|nr:heme lyase CcmF/NrfE family subunit [Cohaesibacteraceae bacterium]MBL4876176.1 heme lyase CcmF/NrfE family subunit [Cohaesibacteraceae bacterium]